MHDKNIGDNCNINDMEVKATSSSDNLVIASQGKTISFLDHLGEDVSRHFISFLNQLDAAKIAQISKKDQDFIRNSWGDINFVPKTVNQFLNFIRTPNKVSQTELDLSWLGLEFKDKFLLKESVYNIPNSIAAKLPNLTSLNLSGCNKIFCLIKCLTSKLPNLTSLNLSQCSYLEDGDITNIISPLQNLSKIDLIGCPKITSVGIKAIISKFPKLISLNMDGYDHITTELAKEIATCLPELTSLELRSININDEFISALVIHSKKLTSLVLNNGIGDDGIEMITTNLLGLTKLDISCCQEITDVGLEKIAKLKNLNYLNLSNTNLSDKALTIIASSLKKLSFIDFTNCENITDEGVKSFVTSYPYFSSINLGCLNITDQAIESIVTMPKITSIEFGYCGKITDNGIENIANNIPNLTFLGLNGCVELTDESIKSIASKLKKLTYLHLGSCYISDEVMVKLRNDLPFTQIIGPDYKELPESKESFLQRFGTRKRKTIEESNELGMLK